MRRVSECERVNWSSKFFVFELSNTDRVIEGPGASGRASGLFTVYCHLFLLLSQRVLLLQCHVGFLAFFFQRVHLLLAGIDYGKLVLKNSIYIYIYIYTKISYRMIFFLITINNTFGCIQSELL